jgi:hypothetical protein
MALLAKVIWRRRRFFSRRFSSFGGRGGRLGRLQHRGQGQFFVKFEQISDSTGVGRGVVTSDAFQSALAVTARMAAK